METSKQPRLLLRLLVALLLKTASTQLTERGEVELVPTYSLMSIVLEGILHVVKGEPSYKPFDLQR